MIEWIRSLFCHHKWRRVGYGRLKNPYYDEVVGNYEDYVCDKCLKTKQLKWD